MKYVETKGEYCTVFSTSICEALLLKQIDERFEQSGADALILGQGPVLSLGYINPLTMECPCPNRGAFAVRTVWLEKFGSLDESLKGAAVSELNAFIKDHGGKVQYACDIIIPYFEKPGIDITDLWLTSLLLDYKVGNKKVRDNVIKQLFGALHYDSSIGNYSRKILIKRIPCMLRMFISYSIKKRRVRPFSESLGYYNPGYTRGCAELHKIKPDRHPAVSIVIRTHKRPEILRKTLQCLYHQCYDNMEIIVVEDGEDTAGEMIYNDFSDLNIRYYATGENVGRSAAANIGFRMASGEYINLLDDDDFLFPGHVIAGITEAEATCADMVFLQGLALIAEVSSADPYHFDVKSSHFMNFPRVDEFTMSTYCMTPDNGVLFKKKLLDKVGMMREELHANEDWSLWLKMMTAAGWTVVPYATSSFVNPASTDQIKQRNDAYREYRGLQFEDDTLWYKESPEKIRGFLIGKINDYLALTAFRQLDNQLMSDIDYWSIDVSDGSSEKNMFEAFQNACTDNTVKQYSAKDFNSWFRGMCAWLYGYPSEKRQGVLEQLRNDLENNPIKEVRNIKFVGFWPGFDTNDNFIMDSLKKKYTVRQNDSPDYIICSMFGNGIYEWANYDVPRIFFSGENYTPDLNIIDYGIGYDLMEYRDRFLHVPEFYIDIQRLNKGLTRPSYEEALDLISGKQYFCNFIYGDSRSIPQREGLFKAIDSIKHVHSAGTWLNNVDGFTVDMNTTKTDYQKNFLFTIAVESCSMPGFITEKMTDAYLANTIPIYYGDPEAAQIFNPDSFINVRDFDSLEEVAEEVVRISESPEMMAKMLSAPVFRDPDYLDNLQDRFERFLFNILDQAPGEAFRRAKNGQPELHNNYMIVLSEILTSKRWIDHLVIKSYIDKYVRKKNG